MLQSLMPLLDDVWGVASRLTGGLLGQPAPEYEGRYGGKFGDSEFFQDAHAGNYRALARLDKEGYGHAWGVPFFRGAVEKEIGKPRSKLPRGFLTGSPMAGYNRLTENLWGKQAKMNLGFGAVSGLIMMTSAPKGQLVKRGVESVGVTTGSAIGAAIGGFALGLPGEIAGGLIGGTVGEKVGAIVEPLEKLGRQAYHLNFGGEYKDSEQAYTMRQRAVHEMGSSALNARMYLGKEAALFHQ
jgi:hypothetical protein